MSLSLYYLLQFVIHHIYMYVLSMHTYYSHPCVGELLQCQADGPSVHGILRTQVASCCYHHWSKRCYCDRLKVAS